MHSAEYISMESNVNWPPSFRKFVFCIPHFSYYSWIACRRKQIGKNFLVQYIPCWRDNSPSYYGYGVKIVEVSINIDQTKMMQIS